jgi:tetratricopeptide (TPR) repeat protein
MVDPSQATGSVGAPGRGVAWPIRLGMPSLADGFSARPETAPSLAGTLVPGATVALVPAREARQAGEAEPSGKAGNGGTGSPDWLRSCGKTQLAVYAAESIWRAGEADLLVWLDASTRASVLSGFVEAAAATASDHLGDAESVAGSFVEWLGETSRSWLIVFDDLRATQDLDGLWPAGPAGRVLITTPDRRMLTGRPRIRTLPVPEFSTREALSYLMGRLTADPDQRLGAIDLVVALGCEPPALAQASAMIATSRLTCREYQGHFDHRRAQLAKTTAGADSAAAVTWTLSVEHAERLSPGGGAQYLLALAALLDGHAIPSAVFTALATCEYLGEGGGGTPVDPNVAWSALLSLERAGLLAVDSAATPATVRMTPTVQTAIRAATTKDVFERAAQAAADALLEVWPADEDQPWLAAHLRSCAVGLQQVAGDALWVQGSCHPLLVRAGRSMDGARLTGPAVAYWRELAATSDRIAGPSSPDTLMAGSQLTAALMAAGQASEAVAWAQWVVAGRSRVIGPDDPSTIAARTALGRAFVAAGQAEAAIPVLENAVGDCERVLGADSLDTLRAQDELATALSAAGRPDDAIALQRRTLSDHERIQGARHPDTMTARQQLADTYLASGRVKDAISQLKRVLSDRERVLGADHMDTIVAQGILASAYLSAGKMASALHLFEQACEGYARVLGPDDPQTLERRANLATVYFKAGRLTDATRLIRDTVERAEQALPPDDPLTRSLRERMSEIIGELPVTADPDRGQRGCQAARRMPCRPFPKTLRAASSRRSRGAGGRSIRCCPIRPRRRPSAVSGWSSRGSTVSRPPSALVSTGRAAPTSSTSRGARPAGSS